MTGFNSKIIIKLLEQNVFVDLVNAFILYVFKWKLQPNNK